MSRGLRAGHHRWLAATAAALFTVCLIALPLNLAHHLHHHAGAKSPSCAFLALAQHTAHATAVTVEIPEPQNVGGLETAVHLGTLRVQPIAVSPARAPPSIALPA